MNTIEITVPECQHEPMPVKRTLGNGVEAYGTQCHEEITALDRARRK